MSKVPSMLECSYCIRNATHGGECREYMNRHNGCLYFKEDEKGCIRNEDLKVPFCVFDEIPLLNVWQENWELYGNTTQIRFKKIYGFSWDKNKGLIFVHANCDYYINEFSKGYEEKEKKAHLKVIK